MPLYCTCSVSQRAIRRGLLPFGGHFVAEIFVQNLKWRVPSYCTCSVSQRAITRGLLPFGGRFVAEIFVQNLKWRVSQRGADVSYILIALLLLYLKNLLSYTAWYNYLFSGFYCRSNLSQPHIYNACVYNAFVLYLLSVTALQKDESYFPSAAVL